MKTGDWIRNAFRELRKRKVLRVAGVYAAAGWVLVEIAATVLPIVEAPEWGPKLVLLVVVLGFPVAVVLAWVFDFTPGGLERAGPWASPGAGGATGTSGRPRHQTDGNGKRDIRSVAVLPFVNISPDDADEYFSDGMTDELISALARVSGLKVAARSSSFAFKNARTDARAVGERLGVGSLVEGSVRRSGERLRVTAQLVATADGYQLWSETFERLLGDVFAIQEEISNEIVGALEIRLADREDARLVRNRTESMEAYQLYLKGRYLWNRRGEGLARSLGLYEEALRADPRYALPYSGIADSFNLLGYYGYVPPRAAFPKAEAAARTALEIDPGLVEARTSLAFVDLFFGWDWEAAARGFREALALGPGYPPARYWYAVLLSALGRHEDALEQDLEALDLDPLSVFVHAHHGWTLRVARRTEDALTQLERAMELEPTFLVTHWMLAYTYATAGLGDEAVEAAARAVELSGGAALTRPALAFAHARAGNGEEARRILDGVRQGLEGDEPPGPGGFAWPSHVAIGYGALGDLDTGFEWLSRGLETRDHWLINVEVDPVYDAFRGDPRFEEVRRSVGAAVGPPA